MSKQLKLPFFVGLVLSFAILSMQNMSEQLKLSLRKSRPIIGYPFRAKYE